MSPLPVAFADICAGPRSEIEAALARSVDPRPGVPPRLADAMRYSLMAGGKRLRPLLALWACEAVGSRREAAMPAAVAVEMVHTYSLIHDDLPAMDDDDLRRGRPTCHKEFDDATAVLAGDALLTLAFETLADRLRADHAAACCRELAVGAGWAGMVGGQHDDLDAEGRFDPTDDDPTGNIASPTDPESIHARKTGALIVASLRIGAITGNASQAELARLAEYGRHLGLAFQIVDDLLDATGDAPTMGKAVGKDVDSGKATYPARFGIDESRRLAERAVAAARDSLSELSGPTGPLESVASFVLDRDH